MDLPDLRSKVRISTDDVDLADAKIKAFSRSVRDSLDRTNVESKLNQSGQAFIKFGKEGEVASVRIVSSMARTRGELDLLEGRARRFADSLERDFRRGGQAVVRLGEDGAVALARFGASMSSEGEKGIFVLSGLATGLQRTWSIATSAWGALSALGTGIVAVVVPALVITTIVLSPLITLLAAFTAGLAATLAVIGLAAGGFGLLGAGVFLLADKTGHLQKQMTNVHTGLSNLADVLGKKAAPMASRMLDLFTGLLPYVGRMGEQLLNWFGPRLEGVLVLAQRAFFGVMTAVERLGPIFGRLFDSVMKNADVFGNILVAALDIGVKAIDGLLTNALALSQWFIDRLPALGPVTGSVMGGIGSAIQGVGRVAGALVDWFITHWPQITATAQATWDQLRAGWNAVGPILQAELPQAVSFVTQLFGYLREHSEVLRFVVELLSASLAGAVVVLTGVGVAVVGVVAGITWLTERIGDAIGALRALIGLIQSIPAPPSWLGGSSAGPAAKKFDVRAAGGPVVPDGVYRVGEEGPEWLYMGRNGGYVVPESSDHRQFHNHLTLHGAGAVNDPEGVRRMLLRMGRLGAAT